MTLTHFLASGDLSFPHSKWEGMRIRSILGLLRGRERGTGARLPELLDEKLLYAEDIWGAGWSDHLVGKVLAAET